MAGIASSLYELAYNLLHVSLPHLDDPGGLSRMPLLLDYRQFAAVLVPAGSILPSHNFPRPLGGLTSLVA